MHSVIILKVHVKQILHSMTKQLVPDMTTISVFEHLVAISYSFAETRPKLLTRSSADTYSNNSALV